MDTTGKQVLSTLEKETKALELRRQGVIYSQIAKEIGTSTAHAYRLVLKGIQKLVARRDSRAEIVLGLELSRLEELGHNVYLKAVAGDLKAVESYLKIMERRSRYLGLDAPVKQDTRHSFEGRSDEELVREAQRYGIELPVELRPAQVTVVPNEPTATGINPADPVRDSGPNVPEVGPRVPDPGRD
jgi:hypothetical protein